MDVVSTRSTTYSDGELFGHDAAFRVAAVIAVEPGGDLLVQGGVRQQVARQLLDRELVEGMLRLNASITQSRHRHMKRSPSVW